MKFWIIRKLERPWNGLRVMLDSGTPDTDYQHAIKRCHLLIYWRMWSLAILLPALIRPWEVLHESVTWIEGVRTPDPAGGCWSEWFEREYGFSVDREALHLHFGPQTHDSNTTKSKVYFLPWAARRFVRFSLYHLDGQHHFTELERDTRRLQKAARVAGTWHDSYSSQRKAEDAVQKISFAFQDYDLEHINARCHIDEREWRAGEGWFKWLSLLKKPTIRRSLSMEFDREVGERKGSWKGGTTGHSIEMLVGDSPEWAFRRYCAANRLHYLCRVPNEAFRENAPAADVTQHCAKDSYVPH